MFHTKTPVTQYAVRVVRNISGNAYTPHIEYLNPDGQLARHLVDAVTTDITSAASFNDVPAARNFAAIIKNRFQGVKSATIVKVEKVQEKQIKSFNCPLGAPLSSNEFLVITRPAIGGVSFYVGSFDEYALEVAKAERFPSIGAALAAADTRICGLKSTDSLAAYRETTEWTFKFTDVEAVEDTFVTFDVQGSTVITRLEYAHESKKLRITMKRAAFSTNSERNAPNAVYQYSNVSAEDVMAFLSAPSKGSYYAKTFKGKYDKGAVKL